LATELRGDLQLPDGFRNPRVVLPGIMAIEGPGCDPPQWPGSGTTRLANPQSADVSADINRFCQAYRRDDSIGRFRWIVIVDDSQFVAESLRNFLWVTFTRANPAADIHGIESFVHEKHWGCHGALVIDARLKPHHAPPLDEDAESSRRVDALAAPGGPLHGII
jgi:4-hydroxy-3-polyprenylbenzoate decarboxylase